MYIRFLNFAKSYPHANGFQSPTAGTAFITFDNVKVPVGNTLGPEGGGIFVMLRFGPSSTPTTHLTHPPCLDTVISTMNAGSWFARPQEVNALLWKNVSSMSPIRLLMIK
jgi:hypothetical protein